mmetsp:Transcript_33791/g.78025  ORF Transcript_33791/g.78025 Transcript_33791/m.78025 type:complete len:219 (+) Transcript_33791:724-1380(+)
MTSNPAALMVVPVSTRSTIPSASPNPQAASTLPPTNLILVSTPFSSSNFLKYLEAMLVKEVTIRPPASSDASLIFLTVCACTHSRHFPNPSFISVTTSTQLSITTSSPVIPISTFPSPTYFAMSPAGRKIRDIPRSSQTATSSRASRLYSIPAPSNIFEHFSYNRPFFGIAIRRYPSGLVLAGMLESEAIGGILFIFKQSRESPRGGLFFDDFLQVFI